MIGCIRMKLLTREENNDVWFDYTTHEFKYVYLKVVSLPPYKSQPADTKFHIHQYMITISSDNWNK